MAERSPLFLGLTRPPKYLGLPVGYLAVLSMGVVLPFIWTKSLTLLALGLPAYGVMWLIADKEPKFFEVLRVSYGKVRGAYSGVIRPVIPKVSGQAFRFYPATDSGASGHPVM